MNTTLWEVMVKGSWEGILDFQVRRLMSVVFPRIVRGGRNGRHPFSYIHSRFESQHHTGPGDSHMTCALPQPLN